MVLHVQMLGSLSRLSTLSVSYSIFSETLANILSIRQNVLLQFLGITVTGSHVNGHSVSSEAWRNLATACLGVRVAVAFEGSDPKFVLCFTYSIKQSAMLHC